MIREGSKTIWEGFEDIESHSHAWNCYPMRLLQEYIAGIHCIAPGFTRTEITPFFPRGITSFCTRVHAAGGSIIVQGWKDTVVRFEVELPEGVTGNFQYGGRTVPLQTGLTKLTFSE